MTTDDLSLNQQRPSAAGYLLGGGVLGAGAGWGSTAINKVGDFVSEPAKYENWNALVTEKQDDFVKKIEEIDDKELVEKAKTARERVTSQEAKWDSDLAAFKEANKTVDLPADHELVKAQNEAQTALNNAENSLKTEREKLVNQEVEKIKATSSKTPTDVKIDSWEAHEVANKRNKTLREEYEKKLNAGEFTKKQNAYKEDLQKLVTDRYEIDHELSIAKDKAEKDALTKKYNTLDTKIKKFLNEAHPDDPKKADEIFGQIKEHMGKIDKNVIYDETPVREFNRLIGENAKTYGKVVQLDKDLPGLWEDCGFERQAINGSYKPNRSRLVESHKRIDNIIHNAEMDENALKRFSEAYKEAKPKVERILKKEITGPLDIITLFHEYEVTGTKDQMSAFLETLNEKQRQSLNRLMNGKKLTAENLEQAVNDAIQKSKDIRTIGAHYRLECEEIGNRVWSDYRKVFADEIDAEIEKATKGKNLTQAQKDKIVNQIEQAKKEKCLRQINIERTPIESTVGGKKVINYETKVIRPGGGVYSPKAVLDMSKAPKFEADVLNFEPKKVTAADIIKERKAQMAKGKKLTDAQIKEQAEAIVDGNKNLLTKEKGLVETAKQTLEGAKSKVTAEKAKNVIPDDELVKKFIEKNGAREEISGKVETELKEGLKGLFERGSKKGGKMALVIGGGAVVGALIGLMCRPKARQV